MSLLLSFFRPPLTNKGHAKKYLEREGVCILAEAYQFAGSEIDFVAHTGRTLLFVVVRTRGPAGCGARESDDMEIEQELLGRAAEHWIKENPDAEYHDVRVDVLRLDWYGKTRGEPVLRYFPGAIPIPGR